MRTDERALQTVPATYARLVLDAVEAHGVPGGAVLRASGVAPEVVDDPEQRIPVLDIGTLLQEGIRLTREPGLGYEIALSSSLMSHGIIGFGMMTSPTLRDAIAMGVEFLHLRLPVLSAELRVEGDDAVVAVVETVPLGPLRRPLFDLFLVKLARIGQTLTDHRLRLDDVEIRFDDREPEYHGRFRHRLPPMSFDRGANELRFPASLLDRRPDTADPIQAELVQEACRREVARLARPVNVVDRVRAELRRADDGYPTLPDVARALHTSTRTLKRRLHDHGTSFHELLDADRRGEATRLLTTTAEPVERIARRLGYADARSFRRAFQAWTGTTPGAFRAATAPDPSPAAVAELDDAAPRRQGRYDVR